MDGGRPRVRIERLAGGRLAVRPLCYAEDGGSWAAGPGIGKYISLE